MNRILYFFIGIAVLYGVIQLLWLIWRMKNKSSQVPPPPKMTLFHVRNLLIQGKKESAIRAYCSIFKVARDKAQKDVDELERNISKKDSE